MGQSNSVATFQRMMSHVFPFAEFGGSTMCFLDDILVFSNTEEEHLKYLDRVFGGLLQQQLYVKRSKCTFGRKEISFVGQVVGHGRRRIDPYKAEIRRNYPRPNNAHDVRCFYGLVNFCRDFLPGLLTVSAPLTDLRKKYAIFNWRPEQEKAFVDVKNMVADAIDLAITDPSVPYILQTDASDVGLGATI